MLKRDAHGDKHFLNSKNDVLFRTIMPNMSIIKYAKYVNNYTKICQ